MKPDYEPKLFGQPMEWDDAISYWADYGCISVMLKKRDNDGTFSYWINDNTGASGISTLTQAQRQIENLLLMTRESIPPLIAQSPKDGE